MFKRCYEIAGVTAKDRVQITPGYGLWTAGIGFQAGCELLGAMAIPMGPGNTDKQLRFMEDMGSTVLGATSSYALLFSGGDRLARYPTNSKPKRHHRFRALGRKNAQAHRQRTGRFAV